MGRGRRWADTLGEDRVQGGKTRTSYLEICSLGLRYKIPGIDFKAGAGMFSAVVFIESIPRGKLTSNEPSWGNHESWHLGLLARGTRKKKILHQRRMNSSLLRFSRAMYGPDLHRVRTGSLICGRPAGASSRLWLVDVN
jgi:hypothetical protein